MTKETTAPSIDPIVDPDVIIEEHEEAPRYSVKGNKLVGPGVIYRTTSKISGSGMKPKFLIIHYTAGTTFNGDLGVLSGKNGGTSCQLVIGPRGEVGAVGKLTDIMWQAGRSRWKGYVDLNNDSIGIEVTCPGWLTDKGNGVAATWSGALIRDSDPWPFIRERHKNPRENHTLWAGFTELQIAKVIEVGEVLMEHYGLLEAVGHDDVAPERKVDPGPCCPASIFHRLNGNQGGSETDVERPDLPEDGQHMRVKGVAPDTLTFRASPNGEKRGELVEGQIVVKVGQSGNWSQVRTPAGYIGWVWSDYLVPVGAP